MSKRRIIVPNPKVEKNDIGKKDKKFNDIYTNNIETVNISTDNINTEKINGEIIDEERYLENQFTIIYPNGGTTENPGIILPNTRYIEPNPFLGYYVNCIAEIKPHSSIIEHDWGTTGWAVLNNYAYGVSANQYGNNIIVQTGTLLFTDSKYSGGVFDLTNANSQNTNYTSNICRIKIWKVGKIK